MNRPAHLRRGWAKAGQRLAKNVPPPILDEMNVVFEHIKVETCVFAANHVNQEPRISAKEGCENHERVRSCAQDRGKESGSNQWQSA